MPESQMLRTNKIISKYAWLLIALIGGPSQVYGQSFEVAPLFGARFGGTMELEQAGAPNFKAHLRDGLTVGVVGGVRFSAIDGEGYDAIEFRWTRQGSRLEAPQDPLAPNPGAPLLPRVVLNHFLGDFTHEFTIQEAPIVQPFITGTLGAVRMSTPESSAFRFAFGIGGGVKIFPAKHWGFRIQAEYLPTLMHTELQKLVCAGGCLVVLNGGIMNQFEVSLGPAFRF